MKRIQKVIGIILVIMLISVQLIPIINVSAEETETLTITTYGENEDGIRSDLVTNTAALTVTSITNGDILSAYKILDTFYNESTNEITYEFTSDFKAFLDQSTNEDYNTMTVEDYFNRTSDNEVGSANTSVITTSTLNVLVSEYATYIRKNKTITGIDMTTTGTNATAENVPVGSYLILPKEITTIEKEDDFNTLKIVRNLYGVMVGNIVFTVDEITSQWVLNDVVVYSKTESSSNRPAIAPFKTMDYLNCLNGECELSEADMENPFLTEISSVFGKKHMFIAKFGVAELPTNAISKFLQFEIDFPTGITYDPKNVYSDNESLEIISDGKILNDTGVQAGTITFNGQKVTINIDPELYSSNYFCFVTDVELNNAAIVGDVGNEIVTRVIVTDDPYVENSSTTLTNSVIMTTYGLELTSYGEKTNDGDAPLLTGAKYEIYTTYKDSILGGKIGEFTVGEDGTGKFIGVPSGTIYLKQTEAPTGYQLIKEPIAVKIATDDAIDGSEDGYYQISTYNQAMWYLPTTGGIGTIIYTIVGLIIIGVSTFGIIYLNKKQITLQRAK